MRTGKTSEVKRPVNSVGDLHGRQLQPVFTSSMSTTTSTLPENISPPPGSTPPGGSPNDQPKSSSLYLCVERVQIRQTELSMLTIHRFTFLSTLFLLLVVSTAIVLRSFLLRRRYHMQLEEQLDDILRQPRDAAGGSRKRNFGAKPKLWDARIRPDDSHENSVYGLADIKVRRITPFPPIFKSLIVTQPLSVGYVPQETQPRNTPSTTRNPPSQERRHERSTAFLASLFTNPLPRHSIENDHPGDESASPSAEIPRTVQLSVVISMPTPKHRKPPAHDSSGEEFPNVAIGFTRLPIPSS